jgi:hypothetical protein
MDLGGSEQADELVKIVEEGWGCEVCLSTWPTLLACSRHRDPQGWPKDIQHPGARIRGGRTAKHAGMGLRRLHV